MTCSKTIRAPFTTSADKRLFVTYSNYIESKIQNNIRTSFTTITSFNEILFMLEG